MSNKGLSKADDDDDDYEILNYYIREVSVEILQDYQLGEQNLVAHLD